jgi:flagellar capping protein FliD
METAFGNTVDVTYKDGQLKVTDKSSGTSQLQVSLAFEAGTGSSASLTLPTLSQATQGGSKTANIASLAAGTFTETQSAKNALIKVDDYPPDVVDVETGELIEEKWISRSSNTIDNVIAGVTLKLHDTTRSDSSTGYTTVEVNLTRNTEELKKKITSMVTKYNELATYFKQKTTYNTETKTSGILSSDYSLSSNLALVKNPLRSVATGFGSSDSFTRPKILASKLTPTERWSWIQRCSIRPSWKTIWVCCRCLVPRRQVFPRGSMPRMSLSMRPANTPLQARMM